MCQPQGGISGVKPDMWINSMMGLPLIVVVSYVIPWYLAPSSQFFTEGIAAFFLGLFEGVLLFLFRFKTGLVIHWFGSSLLELCLSSQSLCHGILLGTEIVAIEALEDTNTRGFEILGMGIVTIIPERSFA